MESHQLLPEWLVFSFVSSPLVTNQLHPSSSRSEDLLQVGLTSRWSFLPAFFSSTWWGLESFFRMGGDETLYGRTGADGEDPAACLLEPGGGWGAWWRECWMTSCRPPAMERSFGVSLSQTSVVQRCRFIFIKKPIIHRFTAYFENTQMYNTQMSKNKRSKNQSFTRNYQKKEKCFDLSITCSSSEVFGILTFFKLTPLCFQTVKAFKTFRASYFWSPDQRSPTPYMPV